MFLKRFFVLLAAFISFAGLALADEAKNTAKSAQPINIIYIHGAYETKDSFDKSVRNVHDDMVKQFESDPLIYKRLLKNGEKKIGEKEIVFFWADKTEQNVQIVDKALAYAKNFGSKVSQFGRATLSHTLHDAIWVSKPSNSKDILQNLNETVKAEHEKGNQVILYGYSAGSLITYQYLTRKMPIIELVDLNQNKSISNSYMGKYFAKQIKTQHLEPTCLDALTESKVVFYTDNDEFVTNPNIAMLKESFPKLNEYTKKYCAPKNTVTGAIVFGTPLTTFNSSISKQGTAGNTLTQFLMKYIVEKDLFLITVNYANDFIGMPMPVKVTIDQFEQSEMLKDVQKNGGFIYDDSGVKCRASIVSAHGAYWTNGKKFAKTITKAYNDGFKYFYKTSVEK